MTAFKTIFLLLAALAFFVATPVRADDAAPASEQTHEVRVQFAKDFADKVLAILQDTRKSFTENRDTLERAFSKSVDIDWIARFVLGHGWSNATPEQKEEYTKLYRKYLTESYVSNFAGGNSDRRIRDIKILGVNDEQGDKFTVRTKILLANSDNLSVNYLVHDEGGHYKVLDIIIENVSLITTHRAEFAAMASKAGMEGVIRKLTQLVAAPVAPITLSMN